MIFSATSEDRPELVSFSSQRQMLASPTKEGKTMKAIQILEIPGWTNWDEVEEPLSERIRSAISHLHYVAWTIKMTSVSICSLDRACKICLGPESRWPSDLDRDSQKVVSSTVYGLVNSFGIFRETIVEVLKQIDRDEVAGQAALRPVDWQVNSYRPLLKQMVAGAKQQAETVMARLARSINPALMAASSIVGVNGESPMAAVRAFIGVSDGSRDLDENPPRGAWEMVATWAGGQDPAFRDEIFRLNNLGIGPDTIVKMATVATIEALPSSP